MSETNELGSTSFFPTSAAICIKQQSKYYIILINMWNMSDFLPKDLCFKFFVHLHICKRRRRKTFVRFIFCWIAEVCVKAATLSELQKYFLFIRNGKKETFELSNILVQWRRITEWNRVEMLCWIILMKFFFLPDSALLGDLRPSQESQRINKISNFTTD